MPRKKAAPKPENVPAHFSPSTVETVDGAFFDFIESLNIFSNTNMGWSKVPVIWASAERAYQIKHNIQLRDNNGSLIPPIISLERGNVTKDPGKKGSFQANVSPNFDRYFVTKEINQEKSTVFSDADLYKSTSKINFATGKKNKKVVYESYSVPIPIYVTIDYKINILTNFQMQMNEIVQPILTNVAQNYFIIKKENHRYEAFMDQDFSQQAIGDLGEAERKYQTTITVKVLGYFITGTGNDKDATLKVTENAVDLKFGRESAIIQDFVDDENQQEPSQSKGVYSVVDSGNYVSKKTFVVGNSVDSLYFLKHSLRTKDLYISVRDNETNEMVHTGLSYIDNNNISLDFGDIIPNKSYTVTIIG